MIFIEYFPNLQIMNHIKIQQIQQNLESAQQQEMKFQAQIEVLFIFVFLNRKNKFIKLRTNKYI